MKKSTLLLIASICCIGIAMVFTFSPHNNPKSYEVKYQPHYCTDQTHLTCDGHCSCDGLGCDESERFYGKAYSGKQLCPQELLRSYQLQIVDDDVIAVYDGYRYVGKIKFGQNKQLDRLIYRDNQ